MSLPVVHHHHTPMQCPVCSAPLNAFTDEHFGRPPQDGDLTLCVMCAAVNVFSDGATKLRIATPEEMRLAEMSADLVNARFQIILTNAARHDAE